SSRRRHTRFSRDWSSDVCSSDLENAGKWGSVEGRRDTMNWAELDAAYELAKENGMAFRLHVLLWGNQQPGWIADLPVEEQREEIDRKSTRLNSSHVKISYAVFCL